MSDPGAYTTEDHTDHVLRAVLGAVTDLKQLQTDPTAASYIDRNADLVADSFAILAGIMQRIEKAKVS